MTTSAEHMAQTQDFIERHRIDVTADVAACGRVALRPGLLQNGPKAPTEEHIQIEGADYKEALLGYFEEATNMLVAARTVIVMESGKRNQPRYRNHNADVSDSVWQVTGGRGGAMLADGQTGEIDIRTLDVAIRKELIVPPGTFYGFFATTDTREPLVVSTLEYPFGSERGSENYVRPGQIVHDTAQGKVAVPDFFRGMLQ